MVRGEGVLEFYNPKTGEIVESCHQGNVILDQGIAALRSGGPAWGYWASSTIVVGTGFSHLPGDTTITQLDNQIWPPVGGTQGGFSRTREANTFTVTAEIPAGECNGDLTEAGIVWNALFNRLMFKSAPILAPGTYRYKVYTVFGQQVSPASAVVERTTGATGAIILSWIKNDTNFSTGYLLFREVVGSGFGYQLLASPSNPFYIDAGFFPASSAPSLTIDNTKLAPSFLPDTFSTDPQPKARTKTAEYAARLRITISFS